MEAMYLLGFILMLIVCVGYGLFIGLRKHDNSVDYTEICKCGGDDFSKSGKCLDCGRKY